MSDTHFTSCAVCSKKFSPKPRKANKFCSMDCYRISQRRGDYKTGHKATTFRLPCANCGNEVVKGLSESKTGKKAENLFCDRTCYDSYRTKIIESNITKCSSCGADCKKSKTSNSYCSIDCYFSNRKAKPKNCVNCKCFFTPVKYHNTGKMISCSSGKTCSLECQMQWIRNNEARKEKISVAFSGSKHPNWQGGSHYMSSRGAGWLKLRKEIKARDGYKCVQCGMTEEQCKQVYKCRLHINHIKPFHQFGGKTALANKPSNLESLCRSCHTKTDAKWRKENSVQYSLAGMFKK